MQTYKQTLYSLTEQTAYLSNKQTPSLKGLLKPFKGKGDFEVLEQQAQEAREGIAAMIQEINSLARKPPFSLLYASARLQNSQSGATHLRWVTKDLQGMGVQHWIDTMHHPSTPEHLLDELHTLEKLRITLNMQMSCMQFIMKQARECAAKIDAADEVLAQVRTSKN